MLLLEVQLYFRPLHSRLFFRYWPVKSKDFTFESSIQLAFLRCWKLYQTIHILIKLTKFKTPTTWIIHRGDWRKLSYLVSEKSWFQPAWPKLEFFLAFLRFRLDDGLSGFTWRLLCLKNIPLWNMRCNNLPLNCLISQRIACLLKRMIFQKN